MVRSLSARVGLLLRQACTRCHQLQTSRHITVHEDDRKGEWRDKIPLESFWTRGKAAAKALPGELLKFGREVREHFKPQGWSMEHGDYKYLWKLNSQQAIDEWVVSTDADVDVGYSKADVSLSNQKCMVFHGFINTQVPDDGKTRYSGYANVRSPYQLKSFSRLEPYDFSGFTHLVIRCRGDGRTYDLNLHMENYYDLMWHDIYGFSLYTRGGPYWQIAKIPLSKFLLSNKGKIQDKQTLILKERVRNLAITLADGVQGPFQLEIDYIGLTYDAYHSDIFFYEMYDHDPLLS